MATTTKYVAVDQGFGRRLAALRKSRGLSQTEFGDLVGATQRMVSNYERKNGRPRSDLIQKMADVLGVDVEDLITSKAARKKARKEETRVLEKLRSSEDLTPQDRKTVNKIIEGALNTF
jgi:transcriptional regulator with XRE-family HTH domain